mgnify:FL=1
MKSLKRDQLRTILYKILSEDYGPMQDPSTLFPGQSEELRAMNDELESKKQGDYASFVSYLKNNITDPKMQALLNSGMFDGVAEDDMVQVQETDLPVSQLQPTQSEIGLADSVAWAAANKPEATAELAAAAPGTVADVGGRIITADGKYIIDGHHRWSQVYIMNPKAKIPVYNLITPDSPIPGVSTTTSGQDYLKMSQLAIGAVDGVIPQVQADTATDIYRTGGNPDTIRDMFMELVPRGSKFAVALEDKLFNKEQTPSAEMVQSASAEDAMQVDMEMPMGGELSGSEVEKELEDEVVTDDSGKALATSTSGEKDDPAKLSLNELFSRQWVTLSENTEIAIGSTSTGSYDEVINRLVSNAVQLYNGTSEEAAKMTSRSEMPQYDKGGTDPIKKVDALKSGHVDWNAPYDQSDMASSASGADREDIKINEAHIRKMIRKAILKSLKS